MSGQLGQEVETGRHGGGFKKSLQGTGARKHCRCEEVARGVDINRGSTVL